MVSKLATLLLFVGLAFGQRSDTVFFQVALNSSGTPNIVALPPSANIGQPYHLVYAEFGDAPGHTCTNVTSTTVPPIVDIWAGGSADINSQAIITNYARIITPNGGSPTNRYRMLASAAGSYPFLSIEFAGWDTVNCIATVLYTGSLSSIDIKKYADFGTFNDRLNTFLIQINTSGDNVIIPEVCANCRITVYALVLYNVTAQTIIVKDIRSGGGFTPLMYLTTYCTGCEVVMPNTNYPILTTTLGGSIAINLQNSTAVSGYIAYRVE
jgi:hypothetical protein